MGVSFGGIFFATGDKWGYLCIILAFTSAGALVTFRRNRRFFVLLKRNVDKVGEACEWKETTTWSICYIFKILKLCSFDF